MAKSWRELKVWQKAHDLVLRVYKETAVFPKEEIYGLTSQVKRAAISIPANIVEGHSRNTDKEFANFLHISRGSLEELRYLLLLSQELGFLKADIYDSIENDCMSISRMLNSFIVKVKQ